MLPNEPRLYSRQQETVTAAPTTSWCMTTMRGIVGQGLVKQGLCRPPEVCVHLIVKCWEKSSESQDIDQSPQRHRHKLQVLLCASFPRDSLRLPYTGRERNSHLLNIYKDRGTLHTFSYFSISIMKARNVSFFHIRKLRSGAFS